MLLYLLHDMVYVLFRSTSFGKVAAAQVNKIEFG